MSNKDPKLFYRRGIAQYMQHDFVCGVRDLNTALSLEPSRGVVPDVYRYLGYAYANSDGSLDEVCRLRVHRREHLFPLLLPFLL